MSEGPRHTVNITENSSSKTIFRDRNTSFYKIFDWQPLKIQMDYSILIVSICMGYSVRMKRVNRISIKVVQYLLFIIIHLSNVNTSSQSLRSGNVPLLLAKPLSLTLRYPFLSNISNGFFLNTYGVFSQT